MHENFDYSYIQCNFCWVFHLILQLVSSLSTYDVVLIQKPLTWLSSRNFFRGGKINCYANFYCYAIVFGPNFREGQKFSEEQTASGGAPCPPVEQSQFTHNGPQCELCNCKTLQGHFSIKMLIDC